MDLRDKKVTVVGLGNSGVNAAILLNELGAQVYATDSSDNDAIREGVMAFGARRIKLELGGHSEGFVKASDLMVVSPGVCDSSYAVSLARKNNIPVISEMELGYQFCKGKIIAITGTNGKSTATTLIGEILKNAGLDTIVCGNIGNSLCGEILNIKKDTWVVLEVSSFQLEKIRDFKPHIAIISNITNDHLDRHGTFLKYFEEKVKIFKNQDHGDFLILNYDAVNLRDVDNSPRSRTLFYSKDQPKDAYIKDGFVTCVINKRPLRILPLNDVRIKGAYNTENVLACCLAGLLAGVRKESMAQTLKDFKGLPHRAEALDVIDGVEYIDDSKGTTVDSTLRALEASDRPVILIAGGRDKNSNFRLIRNMVKEKVKFLILIGEAKDKIREALGDIVDTRDVNTMEDAVNLAHMLASASFKVMLSPMCASFDMFRSYKHRGDVFKKAVDALKSQK